MALDPRVARLAEWIGDDRGAQTRAAARLGIAQPRLSKILTGKRGVDLELAVAIERESAGLIRATEWAGYRPSGSDAAEPDPHDSGTHAAVDPDSEAVQPAAEPASGSAS